MRVPVRGAGKKTPSRVKPVCRIKQPGMIESHIEVEHIVDRHGNDDPKDPFPIKGRDRFFPAVQQQRSAEHGKQHVAGQKCGLRDAQADPSGTACRKLCIGLNDMGPDDGDNGQNTNVIVSLDTSPAPVFNPQNTLYIAAGSAGLSAAVTMSQNNNQKPQNQNQIFRLQQSRPPL